MGAAPASLGARPAGGAPQWPHSTPGAVRKAVVSAQDMGFLGEKAGDCSAGPVKELGPQVSL